MTSDWFTHSNTLQISVKTTPAKIRPAIVRHGQTVLAIAFAIGLINFSQWTLSSLVKPAGVNPSDSFSQTASDVEAGRVNPNTGGLQADQLHSNRFSTLEQAAHAPVPEVDSVASLPEHLQTLALSLDKSKLKEELLKIAMSAVADNNQPLLGQVMTQLGETTLSEWDTDMCTVYLSEALAIYQELEDNSGVAKVQMQLGRMHIVERRRARRAALAYDAGLLARWHLAKGNFSEAEQSLNQAIAENLALNRYGAAARDYEALYQSRSSQGKSAGAMDAALEASRLHASAGRTQKALDMLDKLQRDGVGLYELNTERDSVAAVVKAYEKSVLQLNRATDYNRLYNHYIASGDPVSAWRFRLKSNAALNLTSKRERYHRQAGVLALLYDSNESMDRAKSYLARAHEYFASTKNSRLELQTLGLMREVY